MSSHYHQILLYWLVAKNWRKKKKYSAFLLLKNVIALSEDPLKRMLLDPMKDPWCSVETLPLSREIWSNCSHTIHLHITYGIVALSADDLFIVQDGSIHGAQWLQARLKHWRSLQFAFDFTITWKGIDAKSIRKVERRRISSSSYL